MDKVIELRTKSEDFEREVLTHIYFSPDFIPKALTIVNVNDFAKYGKHFDIITDSYKNEKNLEIAFKGTKLNVSDFFTGSVSLRTVEAMCNDLKDVANAIRIWNILQKGIEKLPAEGVKEYISDIQREIVLKIRGGEVATNDIQSIVKKFEKRGQEYQESKARGNELLGVSTGYSKLDDSIDGLRPGHFWVIGGYTNYGKTSFTLNIVADLVRQGKRVVFYSLEMEDTDIFAKLLGILSNDSGLSIVKGYVKDKKVTEENIQKIIDSKLSIHTNLFDLSEILYSMYEETINNPATVFIVDFIQNMTVKNSKSEYETVTACSLELQQCAKRLNTPIIALSQISNEGARNVSSVMSFKGSGAIASAADLAVEIGIDNSKKEAWLEKKAEGVPVEMIIDVRKNRHGRTGEIIMEFDMRTGRFTQMKDEEKNAIKEAFKQKSLLKSN